MTSVYVGLVGEAPASGFDVSLNIGEHIYNGAAEFQQKFGSPTTLETDLLNIAGTVFAVDRGLPRGEREEFARRIELSIPIVNVARLQPLVPEIERVLRFLSNDGWRLTLRQQNGVLEQALTVSQNDGKTLLFSGGLDSLAAAVEFGKNSQLHLVSHVTRNQQTRNTQQELVDILSQSGMTLPHDQFFVSSRDAQNFNHDVESTQRTRSFLFMALGALVARRLGHSKVLMMAENGQLAIHLPLNHARVGAFSTHTAHPDVLAMMQRVIQTSLAVKFEILNPYVYRTKGEVIETLWKELQNTIPVSSSCWRNTRLPQGATHCGECIPCYVRRIAIETHGADQTAYARNIFVENITSLAATDEGRRNLVDLCEFIVRFNRESELELMSDWPELYSTNMDPAQAIQMYRRASGEALMVLNRYAGVAPLLQ
jgi:7-cyano-7-deazaguanine synthase in queuosine biosynthesis